MAKNSPLNQRPYPRTAVATNRTGDKLWLILVDGKQPFYQNHKGLKPRLDRRNIFGELLKFPLQK